MVEHKAQDVGAKSRTEDVQVIDDIDFKSMLLPKPIVEGLKKSGYIKPSPVQRKALPLVRCGLDLIIQAKAGTGKTCVFTIAALELLQSTVPRLQAIILAPTREIAQQITEVITAIGQEIPGLKACCFVGGYPLSLDTSKARGCHIAVGAPGRMKHLLEKGILNTEHVRLFVLDEADKLMEKAFVEDINVIFSHLPESKQVLACSATYTKDLMEFLSCYMNRGQYVTPEPTSGTNMTVLVGIRQYISVLTHHVDRLAQLQLKENHLLYLLRSISFNQCLVFSNFHTRAVSVCNMLRGQGWSAEWIAGRQEQADRVIALSQLREQKVRVLVTTDLTARGIDIENVNLIINLDVPLDYQTYLHRMGRAGRYGSHGMVITVLSSEKELALLQRHLGAIGGISQSVSKIPEDLRSIDLWTTSESDFEKVYGVIESKEHSSQKKDICKDPKGIDKSTPLKEIVKASDKVKEESNKSECSTDTDEKFSGESTATLSDDSFIYVPKSSDMYINGKDSDKKSEESTVVDEKSSHKNSDESDVIVTCDKQNVPANNDCSCNMFKVQLTDIEVGSEPSVFCAIKSEEHWDPVYSFLVHENEIPLNTPQIVLDSKFYRLKTLQQFSLDSFDVNNSDFQLVNFEKSCKTITNYSFEEIDSVLNDGAINLNTYPIPEDHVEILSFSEIGDFLDNCDNEAKSCLDIENSEKINQVLSKYENSRKKVENCVKCFNCYDIIGWMAVDEKFDMLEKLKNKSHQVFALILVKCHFGNDHLKVIFSSGDSNKIEMKKTDKVKTFNLNQLNITPPISMENIVKQFTLNKKRKADTYNFTSATDAPENSPKIIKNGFGNGEKFVNTKKNEIEKISSSKPLLRNNCSLKVYTTSFSKRNNIVLGKKNSSQVGDVSKKSNQKSRSSTKQKHVQPLIKKMPDKVKQSTAELRQKTYSKSDTNKSVASQSITKSETLAHKKEASKHTEVQKRQDAMDVKKSNEKIVLKSGKEIYHSLDPEQSVIQCDVQNRFKYTSSTGSEDSLSYIDLSQPLLRWNELHDFAESDSESSEESDVLQHSVPPKVQESSSDSSDLLSVKSEVKKQKEFQEKLLKPMKEHYKYVRKVTSKEVFDDCDSLESEEYNHNGFETVPEHQDFVQGLDKDSTNISSKIEQSGPKKFGSYKKRTNGEDSVRPCGRIKSTNTTRTLARTSNKRAGNTHQGNSNQYEQCKDHWGYSYQSETSNSEQSPELETLCGNDLFSEWYSAWYTQVRKSARYIEVHEYLTVMTDP